MSTQQVEVLQSLLGRIKQRADGQGVRLNLGAFVEEAVPEPTISEVESADDDFYDALTSPGRQAPTPSTAAMLAVSTDEPSPAPAELSPLPEPMDVEVDVAEVDVEVDVAEVDIEVDDSAPRIREPLSDSGIELTSSDDIIIEDDVPAVVEAAPSEPIEPPATSEEMAPTEPATAISAMDEFDDLPPRVRPTQAVAPDQAAPPPLPSTGPTKASLDVPPAPAPAEALAQAGRLIVGPEVIERASIPAVQVTDMMGAAAVSQSRNFGDVLNATLKLRFKPPKAG